MGIDSAVIKLNENQFVLRNENLFDGKKYQQVDGRFYVASRYPRKIAEDSKKQGLYLPQINLFERDRKERGEKIKTKTLEVQVSLPKVTYGTNLIEPSNDDFFSKTLPNILKSLEMVGVIVDPVQFRLGILKRVDFSKIILIPLYLGAIEQIIRILAFFDYKRSSDFNYIRYVEKKRGSYIKFYNSTQGFAIYDKLGEILNNGYTQEDKGIINLYETGKIRKAAIKFEFSLETQQSMEAFLRKRLHCKERHFILEDVLKESLAKDILLEQFDKIYSPENTALVTLGEMQENQLENYLTSQKLRIQEKALLYYMAKKTTKIGLKNTIEEMKLNFKGGTYTRYRAKLSKAISELDDIQGNIPNLIAFLRSELEKFELFKIK